MDHPQNGRRNLMNQRKKQAEMEFDKIHLLNYVLSDDEAGCEAAVLENVR